MKIGKPTTINGSRFIGPEFDVVIVSDVANKAEFYEHFGRLGCQCSEVTNIGRGKGNIFLFAKGTVNGRETRFNAVINAAASKDA